MFSDDTQAQPSKSERHEVSTLPDEIVAAGATPHEAISAVLLRGAETITFV